MSTAKLMAKVLRNGNAEEFYLVRRELLDEVLQWLSKGEHNIRKWVEYNIEYNPDQNGRD